MPFFLLKLLGIGRWLKEAATAAFRWIAASPTHMLIFALCASLAANFYLFKGRQSARVAAYKWEQAFNAQKAAYIAAQREAEAKAIAAKQAQEAKDEQRRKDADNALKQDLADDRRRADDYANAHRVRREAPRSAPSGTDLPSPAEAPQVTAGPGDDAIVVSRANFDICTVNSRRLQNAHDWALPERVIEGK